MLANHEASRFPCKKRLCMPGSATAPGQTDTCDNASVHIAFHIVGVRRHPECPRFRGSMAGLHAPLSTLHVQPHDCPRMTRGRCGSLLLHRNGLSPSTPCRFVPAFPTTLPLCDPAPTLTFAGMRY